MRPYAASVCGLTLLVLMLRIRRCLPRSGLKLLVYGALSYCRRWTPYATSAGAQDSALFAAKLLRENDYEVAEGHGWVAQVCVCVCVCVYVCV
jgi:hypothetical protein